MSHAPVRQFVIAGGGTAGWMAAALLSRFLSGPDIRITLVESDEIGTIGVGEATVPLIRQFNAALGIDEPDFVRQTQGSFKLGIGFQDWGAPGNFHFHGFGDFGDSIDGIAPHHHWLKLHALGDIAPVEAWSMPATAARADRFAPPEALAAAGADPSVASYRYAYHFDAGLYARYLRRYAEARGVARIEGRILAVDQDEHGHVTALRLDGERCVSGEYFIDCTGFASLLLGRALGVPFVDWSHWLPCDRAVVVPSERADPVTPYTRSTAKAAGWQWRIPLQHRTGNGHVYASAFIDDDGAARTLLDGLDAPAIGEPQMLRFTTGHRARFWEKNVLGLGLAAGFLEPLESTAIQLIQTSLVRLIETLPDRSFDPALAEEFNRVTSNEYARIRDFLIAHYCRSRRDEPMWRHCARMEIPDTLAHKLRVWDAAARVPLLSEESYQEASWASILIGNGALPRRWDPLVDRMPEDRLRGSMMQRREAIARIAARMPPHDRFIERAVRAPAAA